MKAETWGRFGEVERRWVDTINAAVGKKEGSREAWDVLKETLEMVGVLRTIVIEQNDEIHALQKRLP